MCRSSSVPRRSRSSQQSLSDRPARRLDHARRRCRGLDQDTRFVSAYGITLNGRAPLLLNASRVEHYSVRHEFTTPELPLGTGALGPSALTLPPRSIGLRLDRTISEGIHEDLDLVSYAAAPVRLRLEIALRSDFADIFEVRAKQLVRRGDIQPTWHARRRAPHDIPELDFPAAWSSRSRRPRAAAICQRAPGLRDRARAGRAGTPASLWAPAFDRRRAWDRDCNALSPERRQLDSRSCHRSRSRTSIRATATYRQSVEDMGALRIQDHALGRSVLVPAAGIPWYATVFGRDSLIVACRASAVNPVGRRDAQRSRSSRRPSDDWRDAQPGKIPHEMRFGELAHFHKIPHTPYYGTPTRRRST